MARRSYTLTGSGARMADGSLMLPITVERFVGCTTAPAHCISCQRALSVVATGNLWTVTEKGGGGGTTSEWPVCPNCKQRVGYKEPLFGVPRQVDPLFERDLKLAEQAGRELKLSRVTVKRTSWFFPVLDGSPQTQAQA